MAGSMPMKLLALHGFTLNGARMREQLGPLAPELERHAKLECPDAPHTCPQNAAARLQERWGLPVQTPPHLRWWNATDDGRTYAGWHTTRDYLTRQLAGSDSIGVLGFSQGAMVAATIAALSANGDMPQIRFVVCIAGSTPRAEELAPAFAWPIQVPSLHVWGENDRLTGTHSPALADHFAPELRQVCVWHGAHSVPTKGAAAEAIVDFVRRHA